MHSLQLLFCYRLSSSGKSIYLLWRDSELKPKDSPNYGEEVVRLPTFSLETVHSVLLHPMRDPSNTQSDTRTGTLRHQLLRQTFSSLTNLSTLQSIPTRYLPFPPYPRQVKQTQVDNAVVGTEGSEVPIRMMEAEEMGLLIQMNRGKESRKKNCRHTRAVRRAALRGM